MRPKLFKNRNTQSRLLARGRHALDPASPLLDEAQFMEDAADHSVSQPRYAPAYVLNGKAEGQDAGILHFDAVIKNGQADGSAFFCVVGVYDGIDDCLAKGNHRNRPAIHTPHRCYHRFPAEMLLDERNCLIRGLRQVAPNFARVHDPRPVLSGEASGLQPGIREAVESVSGKKEKSADSRNVTPLMFRRDSKAAKCRWRQFSDGCKQLGSNSEVECFLVQFRDRLLVKRFELAKPTHFIDLRLVGTPICGSHANEDACFWSKTVKVVGARRAWVNLHHQYLRLSPGHNLDIGNQAWSNRVRD